MKITKVRVHALEGRLQERFGWSLNWTWTRTATLVEVQTDAGITGWGDGPAGRDPSLAIGRSPLEMEAIFDELREPARAQRDRGEPTSAGLDTALWDIAGKALGLPVSALLGRRYHDRILPYCTCLYRKDWPDLNAGLAAEARSWVERGYRALKMKIGYGPKIDAAAVAAVRNAIGPEIELGVDSNCAYDTGTASALGKQLERFDLMWWEEPIWADDVEGYDRLRREFHIPLASGETMPVDWIIRNYLRQRRVDVVQPDLDTVGLTGGRRITAMAAYNNVRLVPHNWGTAVRTAGELHWMACWPGEVPMFEFDQTENPFRDAVVRERIAPESDGRIPVPQAPGLGIEVDEDAVARFRTELREYS